MAKDLLQKFPIKPQSESSDTLDSELHEFKLSLRSWINKRFKQKVVIPEPELDAKAVEKHENSFINDPNVIEMAVTMANGLIVDEKELLIAARFISGIREPSEELFREGQEFYEDDPEFAIMYAFGISRTEKNRLNLRSIAKLSTGDDHLTLKHEQDPLMVVPGHYSAVDAVDAITRAIDAHKYFEVNLGGKYSDNSHIAKDPKNGMLWLVKPGEKKLSPALGIRQERANLAQRETAFYQCADEMGLGAIVPKTFLLKINNKFTAVMPFLPHDFVQADKIRKANPAKVVNILDKYKNVGQLHIWGAMEIILGNCDSHGGNILLSNDGSVALIDHGGSFAGDKFNPAIDPSSFCPFYLRYTVPKGYKKMDFEERYHNMPKLDPELDKRVKEWVLKVDGNKISKILNEFDINPDPVLKRLSILKKVAESNQSISDFIDRFWSGFWDTNTEKADK
jgi:hypothetical protein